MAIVEIPTDAEATTATVRFSGTGTPGTHEAPVAVTVKPELTLRIPAGSVDNPENSFGPGGQVTVRYVAPGTKIRWVNDDTVETDRGRPKELVLTPPLKRVIEALKSSQDEIHETLAKLSKRYEGGGEADAGDPEQAKPTDP